jgi:hypothetical protein
MKIKKLRLWMLANDVRVIDIAKDLNVDHSTVSHVLAGRGKSKRVMEYLREKGCPDVFLCNGQEENKAT